MYLQRLLVMGLVFESEHLKPVGTYLVSDKVAPYVYALNIVNRANHKVSL